MFEKEAEELFKKKPLGYEMKPELEIYTDGFNDGYNKAKEEMQAQIEKMKLCQNCKFEDCDYLEEPCSVCTRCLGDIKRKGNSDKWELQENNNEQSRT